MHFHVIKLHSSNFGINSRNISESYFLYVYHVYRSLVSKHGRTVMIPSKHNHDQLISMQLIVIMVSTIKTYKGFSIKCTCTQFNITITPECIGYDEA